MNRRAAGAVLCAAAAIALLLSAVMPWWRVTSLGDRDVDGRTELGARANLGLLSGEMCFPDAHEPCHRVAYSGRAGLRDDLFAWAGRATLALIMVAAVLAVVLAFLGGGARAGLRAACTTLAIGGAASGACVVVISNLPPMHGAQTLGGGWWFALFGSALLAAGAAWPIGAAEVHGPGRRWGLASGIVAALTLAWLSLAMRAWWIDRTDFGSRSRSPLGGRSCIVGICATTSNGYSGVRSLVVLAMITALAAAGVVLGSATAIRTVRGAAPGRWSIATAAVAIAAIALAGVALFTVPNPRAHVSYGAGLFIAGMLAVAITSLVARQQVRSLAPDGDPDDPRPRVVPFGTAPRGPKPILPPLGNPPPGPAPITSAWPVPSAPPAIIAYAPALSPAPLSPMTRAIGAQPSPVCPQCRAATLWHGKHKTWWCSQCKRSL
jgi:hypothetical protein